MKTMKPIEVITYKGMNIDIHIDEDAESPNSWHDDNAFIVYDHRQFYVNREGFLPIEIHEHITTNKRMFYEGYYVFPLYAYIHSGVSLSLGRSGYPFNDRWDVSSTGFVLVKRKKGWSYTRDKAYEIAASIVQEWNEYLDGEVYGYASPVSSCWGYYGDTGREQMIAEAKGEIDAYIANKQRDHLGKLKTWIKNHVPLEKRIPMPIYI